jgi:(p)ppGpp synthase/HD superfamily hydrolase
MSQYLKAVDLALVKHLDQKYGKHPYIAHLYEVAQVYLARNVPEGFTGQYEASPELDAGLATCYLHDIVEDTDVTQIGLLEEGFSPEVAFAVGMLTKRPEFGYDVYIDRVMCDPLAREVKICDTIANLSNSVKEGNRKRIKKYSKQLELLMKEDE